jgi:hypothetical protein
MIKKYIRMLTILVIACGSLNIAQAGILDWGKKKGEEIKRKGKEVLKCPILDEIPEEKIDLCESLVCPFGGLWKNIHNLYLGKKIARKAAEECACACKLRGHTKAFDALIDIKK